MKKLLWVGDGPDCPSGFGKATREIVDVLRESFDVTILGMNYRGDPSSVPYVKSQQVPVYAAAVEGDSFGVKRLIWMCDLVKPDVIFIQQDGWNLPMYTGQLSRFKEYVNVPVVASVAVDGKNFCGGWMSGVSSAIFWTQFALDEARAGGYVGPATVIPLGVDTSVYHPGDKYEARLRLGLPRDLDDAFIVGNVNRNQWRKRWDLTVKYFAGWIKQKNVRDAWLYLHTAPTGDTGCDVKSLAKYYGVLDRLITMEPPTWYGVEESSMRDTYNAFDVAISTTQGEGFGLTALEAMACGVPVVLPDWSAFGCWAKGSAWLVPCTSTAIGPPFVNVIGGVPDEAQFTRALNRLYLDRPALKQNGQAALECAQRPAYRWRTIGEQYAEIISKGVLNMHGELVVQ